MVQGIECYSHFQDGKQYISFVVKRKLFVEYMQQLKTKNFDEVELKNKRCTKIKLWKRLNTLQKMVCRGQQERNMERQDTAC